MTDDNGTFDGSTRRRFLALSAVAGAGALAGCGGGNNDDNRTTAEPSDSSVAPSWYGSGPGAFEQRPTPGGTSMADMPDMSGTLNVYSGRGEGLVGDLLAYMEERY